MSEVAQPRKFKLRRPKPVEEIIQKNLEPLKVNIQKKQRAQEAYYENHNEIGISPLRRGFRKKPVHQRLGRKLPYTLGTNTSALPPKRRLRYSENQQINRRTRVFTAQQRLNRIRARNQEVVNLNVPKRIKLRRNLPHLSNGPTNFTVEVKNNSSFYNNFGQSIRRFRQVLNAQLQQEIKKIQMEFQGHQEIAPIRIKPAATEVPLHKRFASLT